MNEVKIVTDSLNIGILSFLIFATGPAILSKVLLRNKAIFSLVNSEIEVF